MLNLSSYFINKKILIFLFLFLFISGIAIPKTTYGSLGGTVAGVAATTISPILGAGIWAYDAYVSRFGADKTCVDKLTIGDSIIYNYGTMFFWVPQKLASLAAAVTSATGQLSNYPITRDTGENSAGAKAFKAGWVATRDLANMLIVLGFVIVGIATSLRIREYEAKKALFPLIIVALLINFSGLFCGLIIDASNLTMKGLLSSGSGLNTGLGVKFINDINKTQQGLGCAQIEAGLYWKFFGSCITYFFVYLLITITFLFLAVTLIARYVMLGILYVLAPIAFACYAFPVPQAKAVFNKWWEGFISWAFVGIGITFFLSIASAINNGIDISTGGIMSLLTMLAVIIAGIMISLKSSPAIGGAVVGLAKGAGMLMLGGAGKAAMGLAKMTDKATGSRASTGLQNLKSGYGTALERVGLRATGTTAGANAKQVDDVAGTLSKEYAAAKATGNTGSMDRVHALATKGRGAQAAAAMKVLADNKDLGNAFKGPTALNDMANRMKYAELNGAVGIREKAEKLDPRLKAFNDVEANKIMQPISKGGRGITNRDVAGTTLVNEGYSKASVSDIREYSTDTLANTAFINNVDGRKIAKAGEEMSSAKVAAIKNHKNELMTQMAAAHASGNHAEYNKLSKKMGNVMGL